ncbi:MAG: hypothetical protein HYY17_11440 [Planctomycetes bacterium]|nr:hypothetical protein [Planctomycetota bacterium]
MPGAARHRTCPKCGEKYDPRVSSCPECTATNTVGTGAVARVSAAVKDRIRSGAAGDGPLCPFCRAEITWDNVASIETETTIYVREKIFFCPKCRAFLGVSSWHSEG